MAVETRSLGWLLTLATALAVCAAELWLIRGAIGGAAETALDGQAGAYLGQEGARRLGDGSGEDAHAAAPEGDGHGESSGHHEHELAADLSDGHRDDHTVFHNVSGTCPTDHDGVGAEELVDGGDDLHEGQCADHGRRLGGHEGEDVSEGSMTAGYFMLLFVAFNMTLLYLVNVRDADVRKVFRHMICMALCVYCAVLINEALSVFVFQELRKLVAGHIKKFGRGTTCINTEVIVIVGGMVYLAFVVTLNVRCYQKKDDHSRLAAASLLYGHLAAFAGITMFGHLQDSHEFKELVRNNAEMFSGAIGLHVIICVMAAISLWCMLAVGKLVRGRLSPSPKGTAAVEEGERKAGEDDQTSPLVEEGVGPETSRRSGAASGHNADKHNHWTHHVLEGEQDATALILGYLTLDVVTVAIRPGAQACGLHGCHRGDVCDWTEVLLMAVSAVLFFAVLIIYCEMKVRRRAKAASSDGLVRPGGGCFQPCKTCLQSAVKVFSFRMYLAVSMAWCAETFSEWLVMVTMPKWHLSTCRIVSAFLCTIFAVVMCFFTNYGCKGCATSREASDAEKNETEFRMDVIHDISAGYAFLVGLSWERAYSAIEHTIVMGTCFMKDDPVRWTMILSLVLVCIVLPGWICYVVPSDRVTREQHEEAIRLEKSRGTAPRRNGDPDAE